MTWSTPMTKVRLDAAADDPKLARSELATNVDLFNQLQAHVTSYIEGLLDDADAAAARTTLELIIGTDVQAFNADLLAIAGLTSAANKLPYYTGSGAAALANFTAAARALLDDADAAAMLVTLGAAAIAARETSIATTSGTAHGWTGIQAGANRITLMLSAVSLSGSDKLLVQIGDSGGYETSVYDTRASEGTNGAESTAGFLITKNTGGAFSGSVVFERLDGNEWVNRGNLAKDGTGSENMDICAGNKTLSAELDRIQLTRTGSDTFDAGEINILIK